MGSNGASVTMEALYANQQLLERQLKTRTGQGRKDGVGEATLSESHADFFAEREREVESQPH